MQKFNMINSTVSAEDLQALKKKFNDFVARTETSLKELNDVTKEKFNVDALSGKAPPVPERYRRIFAEAQKKPIKDKTILWMSHYGAGMTCSPYAMFLKMIKKDKYRDYTHYWVINLPDALHNEKERWRDYNNVRFVSDSDPLCHEAFATASHIVINSTLPARFSKRDGQKVINTWHSVTVKTLGFDEPRGIIDGRNTLRSLLATDYLLSPNPFMNGVYRSSYKLDGIFEGAILQTGFPRVDLTLSTSRESVVETLSSRGIKIDDRKIVLFAPTWRGEGAAKTEPLHKGFIKFIKEAKNHLDPVEYQLLVKPHSMTYRAMLKAGIDVSEFVPPDIDSNELLAAVDVLVSDYSSIFYDFLPTGRQVLFYTPDIKKYSKERGVVLLNDDFPGLRSGAASTVIKSIGDKQVVEKFSNKYQKLKESHCPWDDGQATERAIKHIFDASKVANPYIKGQGITVPGVCETKKTKVLIYGGTFQMNGVTTSLLAKLKQLDYSKVDVTLYVPVLNDKIQLKLISWVPKEVRVIMRIDTSAATELERMKSTAFLLGKLTDDAFEDEDLQIFHKREARRIFGDAKFDCVIDYSGYNMLWMAVLRKVPSKKLVVWQHNELGQDMNNLAKKSNLPNKHMLPTLSAVASMYSYVDEVVACGKNVMDLNRAAMETPKNKGRFSYIDNIVDFDRVEMGMRNRYCFPRNADDPYLKSDKVLRIDNSVMKYSEDYVYADVTPTNKSGWKAKRIEVPLPRQRDCNFVSMARLSVEKNHENLIRAFSLFAYETPNSALYLIGDGKMRQSLTNLIAELKLQNRVHLTGVLKNPFGLASLCDCFVLPSQYEGLPLSPLEARAMQLHLLMAKFGSVESVSIPNGQLVVDGTIEGLLYGLRSYRDGLIPIKADYDFKSYNKEGIEAFNKLIGI